MAPTRSASAICRSSSAASTSARSPCPSPAPAPTSSRCSCARAARRSTTCSTAARCGSPTARMPTCWWCTRRPIRRRGPRGISAFIIERGFKGFTHGAEARQARHARLEHQRAGVRGLRGAGGQPARHGKRRRARADERPRLRARGARRRPARPHGRGARCGAALRARAQAVRPADRHLRARAGKARRHVRLA